MRWEAGMQSAGNAYFDSPYRGILVIIINLLKVMFLPSKEERMNASAPDRRVATSTGCALAAWTSRLSNLSVTCKNDILLLLNRLLKSYTRIALHRYMKVEVRSLGILSERLLCRLGAPSSPCLFNFTSLLQIHPITSH